MAVKNDLEKFLISLDANLQFASELLQADIRLFARNQQDEIYVRNYFHPNQDSLYLGPQKLNPQIGVKLSPHKDVSIEKAFRLGRPIVGQFGLVINNRRIQEFAFPIFLQKEVVAVIAVERDIYTTRTTLGPYWDFTAELLVKAIQENCINGTKFPNIAFGEGAMLIKEEKDTKIIHFANPLAVNLLSDIAEHENQLLARPVDDIFGNFPRKERKNIKSQSVEKIEEIGLRQRNIAIRYVRISDEILVALIKDNSELKMKETLLKEIHHRVKNNLQTVVSLLRMQKRRNPDLEQPFTEAINRTNSIALVHEHLARSNDIENVDFGHLAQTVLKGLLSAFGADEVHVNIDCPRKALMLSEDATNLALVFNEILTNTLEHTMAKLSHINVKIYAEKKNLHMIIEDDGGGFPEGFDYKQSTGLGWQIIRNISEDNLRGTLSVENVELENSKRGIKVDLFIPNILTL